MNESIKNKFSAYLKLERGLKESSIPYYFKSIEPLSCKRNLLEITEYREVSKLIQEIAEERKWSESTRYKCASVLKVFYDWAWREKLIEESPFRLGHGYRKPTRKEPEFFDWDDPKFELIMNNPNNTIRVKCILHVLRSSGIRASELCNLYKTDVSDGWLHVRDGKGGRDRFAPMDEETQMWLKIYMKELEYQYKGRYLFTNEKYDKEMNPHSLWKMLYRMGKKHGVKCYPHKFRHSLGGKLVENGADLSIVRDVLGHKSISSTSIYVHHKNKTLKEKYDQALKKA